MPVHGNACSFIEKLYLVSKVEKKTTNCVRTDREGGLLCKKRTDMNKGEGARKFAKLCGHPLWKAPKEYSTRKSVPCEQYPSIFNSDFKCLNRIACIGKQQLDAVYIDNSP